MLLDFFRLPEGDGGAAWIPEDTHMAVARDLADVDDDFGAKGFCFDGRGFDVIDADVGQPHGWRAGHGMFHHTADGIVAVFDEGVVHAHAWNVFELPIEEFGVEGFGVWDVGGVELRVDEWVCHDLSLVRFEVGTRGD